MRGTERSALVSVGDDLVDRVASFLHLHLDRRRPVDEWRRILRYPWASENPVYGYALLRGEEVVGVVCTCYSRQEIRGGAEPFCNLHSWCVHPLHRAESVRLLAAALGDRKQTVTTLTVSRETVDFLKRFGFRPIDEDVALIPTPLFALDGWQARITAERPAVLAVVDEAHRRMLSDFGVMRLARAIVARRHRDWCLCLYTRERRRGIAVCRVVYVSHPPLFTKWLGAFARSWLLKDGTLLATCPPRFLTHRPAGAFIAREPRPQLFRSSRLDAPDITCLYSELTR